MAALYNTIHICLPYLAITYLCLFVLILLGWCLLNLFIKPIENNNSYLLLFIFLLVGIMLLVLFYSVCLTGFKTVNLGIILILLFLLYELKSKLKPIRIKNILKKSLLFTHESFIFLLIIPLLIFIWQVFPFISESPLPFLVVNQDYIYAGRLSEFLNLTGEENRYFAGSLLMDVFKGSVPYHYFELWMNAAVSKCFGINSTITLILVTRTILLSNLILGFLALIHFYSEHIKTNKVKLLFLKITGLLFVFFCGFPVKDIVNSAYWGYSEEVLTNVMMQFYQKTAVVYLFLTGFILALVYKKPGIGIIILLILPVTYFTLAPGIFIGMLFSLLTLWLFQFLQLRDVLRYLSYFIIILMFVYFYYHWNENVLMSELVSSELKTFKDYYNNPHFLADMRYLITIIPLTSCAGFLIWVMLIFFSTFKNKNVLWNNYSMKVLCIFALCLYIGGLLAWLVFHFLGWDSAQFYSNLSPPIINLLFLVFLLFIFRKKIMLLSAIITPFLLFSGWFTYKKNKNDHFAGKSFLYSSGYIIETEKKYRLFPNTPVVFLLDSNSYYDSSHKGTYCYVPLKHLAFFPGIERLVSLDVFNIPHEKTLYHKLEDERAIKTSMFYLFCHQQKREGKFISIEQSQLDFIDKYKVKFLVMEKNSKPSKHLEHLFQSEIKDEITGERFITLK